MINSNRIFFFILIVFILSLAVVTCYRSGKDLKVGLFGVDQVLHKKSPYENPTDSNRPLFRYGPAFAIMQYPFMLTSRMVAPFEFEGILPSVFAWYMVEILALLASMLILLKLIPSPSESIGIRNIKLSFVLAMPLIAYELANGQNKLIALFFMLLAIWLFEQKKALLAAVSFSLALTVYIALFPFVLYFILRSRGRFIFSLIAGAFIIFILIPSVVFGIRFNNFLLKEWFVRCLKPFLLTTSYTTYMELRSSSQSLPSALGRIFIWGRTGSYKYLISPQSVHLIIRAVSATIILLSCLAVWKQPKEISRGLSYLVFLPLGLMMPSYCIWYTWAWLFVFYFAIFNYVGYPQVAVWQKKLLIALAIAMVIASYSIVVGPLNNISVLCWATVLLWAGTVTVLIKNSA